MPQGLALLFVLALLVFVITLVGAARMPQRLKLVLCLGLALRLAGSIAYFVAFSSLYSRSDARDYLLRAVSNANRMWAGDFSMFTDPHQWVGGRLWGTNFVGLAASVTAWVVGPSPVANYLLFSLAASIGLAALVRLFRRTYPDVTPGAYAKWIWLFPTLWFWPSSVGKEALIILGFGLTFSGYFGGDGKIRWVRLAAGLAVTFLTRPQVLAVVVISLVFGHWMARVRDWSIQRVAQGVILVVAAIFLMRFTLQRIGVEDPQGVAEYVRSTAGHAAIGRTAVGPVGTDLARAPLATFNVLFRPLPWEVSNVTGLVSAVEIWVLWFLAFRKRRNIWAALKRLRSDRLLASALTFIIVYSTLLGMVVANLGIIARQRACVFPALFLFFEAVPGTAWRPRRETVRQAPNLPEDAADPHGLPALA